MFFPYEMNLLMLSDSLLMVLVKLWFDSASGLDCFSLGYASVAVTRGLERVKIALRSPNF